MKSVDLLPNGFRIVQDSALYRFTSDSVLLSRFASYKAHERAADFCAGGGIVGLHFFALHPETESVCFVELQEELAALARESAALSAVSERCKVLCMPVQALGAEYDGAFSLILCNPPYERTGLACGDKKRALCRKEIAITFAELAECAARKLAFGGRFAFAHRADRLAELIYALKSRGLEPKRLQFVAGRAGEKPYLLLMEAVKGGKEGIEILPLKCNAEGGDGTSF